MVDEHGARASHCRECGVELGAGYLCDDCDTVDVTPLPSEIDTVVVVGQAANKDEYHAPDDKGKPVCGIRARRPEILDRQRYKEKDRSVLPNHSLCELCEDRLGGGMVDRSPRGPYLAYEWEGMDA